MSDNVQAFVSHVAAGENTEALQSFHAAINDKLQAAIEAKRIEVAQNMIQRYRDHQAENENTE